MYKNLCVCRMRSAWKNWCWVGGGPGTRCPCCAWGNICVWGLGTVLHPGPCQRQSMCPVSAVLKSELCKLGVLFQGSLLLWWNTYLMLFICVLLWHKSFGNPVDCFHFFYHYLPLSLPLLGMCMPTFSFVVFFLFWFFLCPLLSHERDLIFNPYIWGC